MGFASKIAISASPQLSPALRLTLERQLVPAFERFLANAPEMPPADQGTRDELLLRFVDSCWPMAGVLVRAGGELSDAFSAVLDDVGDTASPSATRRRAVAHLEEALSSLLRVQRSLVAWANSTSGALQLDAIQGVDVGQAFAAMTTPEKEYLLGILASLVAFERSNGQFESFAAWAWLARKTLLTCESTLIDVLRQQTQPPRIFGAWSGRLTVPGDFDDELPEAELAPFYESEI